MKSLILAAPRELRVTDAAKPTPGPGELLVRVEAATTCGTDLKAFRRGHPQIPMPGPFGHEYSGVVIEAGPEAPYPVGTAVMGVHSAPCQVCFWCQRDQENLCESIMATKVLGSYAEFLLIPARIARLNVYKKPDWLPFDQASLLEPLACVAQGVIELERTGGIRPTDRVLVIGPGAIGLMFVAAFRTMGLERVTLAGRNPDRLAVGSSLGARTVPANEIPAPEVGPPGYDIVIECTGMPEVWASSIDHVVRGGRLMLFGGPPGGTTVTYSTHRVHYDQITLLSPFHFGTAAVRRAFTWLARENMDLSGLISGHRTLDEAAEVFADLEAGRGIKYAFLPSGPGSGHV